MPLCRRNFLCLFPQFQAGVLFDISTSKEVRGLFEKTAVRTAHEPPLRLNGGAEAGHGRSFREGGKGEDKCIALVLRRFAR